MDDTERHRPSDSDDPQPGLEEWQRPLDAQIANVRHRTSNMEQRTTALDRTDEKIVRRLEGLEERLTMMESQWVSLPVTINDVMEKRADAARVERRKDLKDAFGRTKTVALYVTALGQAILMLAALYYFIAGSPL